MEGMKLDPAVITAIMGGLGVLIGAFTSHRTSQAEIGEKEKMREEESRSRREQTAIAILTEQVEDLKERVDGLYEINQELREQNASQKYKILSLELENENLLKQNLEYEEQITNLEVRVNKLENELEDNSKE